MDQGNSLKQDSEHTRLFSGVFAGGIELEVIMKDFDIKRRKLSIVDLSVKFWL
jgi:hypothetical protein